jgi:hypothetical protein
MDYGYEYQEKKEGNPLAEIPVHSLQNLYNIYPYYIIKYINKYIKYINKYIKYFLSVNTNTVHCFLPKCNVFWQRYCDCLPAKLEANKELCADNGDEDPALPAQLITLGIVEELEGLPQPHCSPQQDEEEPHRVEEMLRRHPQHKLQVECVQL